MGTFLLNTPIATVSNESIGGINALFTGTTAVCITGLTIFDTATTFSLFG
jgi:trk system potassium uptake protein TrkH